MYIKRRLYISNILMIIIPVVLSITIAFTMGFVLVEIFDIGGSKKIEENKHYESAVMQVKQSSRLWFGDNDLNQIKLDVNRIAATVDKNKVSISIYYAGTPVYSVGGFFEQQITGKVSARNDHRRVIINNEGIYKESIGKYTIVVVDKDFAVKLGRTKEQRDEFLFHTGLLLFVLIVISVMLTNRFLTRIVFNSIATPLDTLVNGVHQIRDGNLNYKIDYKVEDEFKEVCDDFNDMADQLLTMEKAKEKDDENRRELIAGISHDLRTPLTSIKAYVEGLIEGVASTPEVKKRYLETIKNKTDDLEHIVNQLFMFSKIDIGDFPLRMENLKIGEQLADFVDDIAEEYEKKGIKIVLGENVKNIIVSADRVQFCNVLINAIENSLKYGNKENNLMLIECKEEDTNVIITMTDNGPGVPEEACEKLFKIFYRGDRARSNTSQGSGLGLAISAKIIERFGGLIKANNAANGGLAITISLPIVLRGENDEENINN
ncbi:HAMP domain-containing histidine kinase [Selenomonadales bacterium OttesenSCG-928-I06]|nr:HAMP domain-containing histidine kinase [Selenomonadales bacterium OttesenSCG-928-I06]